MKAEFTWTVDELIAARKLHLRHIVRLPFRIIAYGMVVLSLIGGVALLIHGDWLPGAGMMGVPIYFVFLLFYMHWGTRRHFRTRPDKDAVVTTIFNEDKVQADSNIGDRGESPWSSFHKAVVGHDGVLLYYNSQMFRWLPKHAFSTPEDFTRFVELVQRKIKKQFKA